MLHEFAARTHISQLPRTVTNETPKVRDLEEGKAPLGSWLQSFQSVVHWHCRCEPTMRQSYLVRERFTCWGRGYPNGTGSRPRDQCPLLCHSPSHSTSVLLGLTPFLPQPPHRNCCPLAHGLQGTFKTQVLKANGETSRETEN